MEVEMRLKWCTASAPFPPSLAHFPISRYFAYSFPINIIPFHRSHTNISKIPMNALSPDRRIAKTPHSKL